MLGFVKCLPKLILALVMTVGQCSIPIRVEEVSHTHVAEQKFIRYPD